MDLAKYSTGLGTINHISLQSIKIKIPKNKNLMKDLEQTFNKIENLQEEVKNADNLYNQYIKELSEEAIPLNKQFNNKLIEDSDNEEQKEVFAVTQTLVNTTSKKSNKKKKTKKMNMNVNI